jgi:hypothetical protein
METKDWLTLIALIATIISSHWLASKQTRKSKKAKWIEDFRFEMAKFFSLGSQYKRNDIKTLLDFSASSWILMMLLDESQKGQKELIAEIAEFGLFITERLKDSIHIDEYQARISRIKDLAKAVITIEEKKL